MLGRDHPSVKTGFRFPRGPAVGSQKLPLPPLPLLLAACFLAAAAPGAGDEAAKKIAPGQESASESQAPAAPTSANPRSEAREPPDPRDEELARLAERAVRKLPVPRLSPELFENIDRDTTILHFDLAERQLELRIDGATALACPIACGRLTHPTPSGTFAIAAKDDNSPKSSDYGSLIDAKGNLLLKGVYSKLDPIPLGAAFVPAPASIRFKLDNGTVVHSGDANGTASTDGSIVIPTTVARTLFQRLGAGFRVVIE